MAVMVGPLGTFFRQLIPAGLLFGTEIGAIEKFLQTEDLHFLLGGIGDQALVFGDHLLLDVRERIFLRRPLTLRLNQATADVMGHATPPEQRQAKSLLRAGLGDKVSAAKCELW